MDDQNPFQNEPAKGARSRMESSAGVPPAVFLPRGLALHIRSRRLPHWEVESAVYFVTFRLADSLPKKALDKIRFTRRDIRATAAEMGRKLSATELRRLKNLSARRIENALDAGAGHCYLHEPTVAAIVADALAQFDGTRYRLFAWCVMPNHVHVVFQTAAGHTLEGILHSWKSYSSKRANEILGRSGEFWQHEYYDHLIRNMNEFERAVDYVLENPMRANLKEWPWVWLWKECSEASGSSELKSRRRDAGATGTGVTEEKK
jgi:menaquinone-specific isochorismate synthase